MIPILARVIKTVGKGENAGNSLQYIPTFYNRREGGF